MLGTSPRALKSDLAKLSATGLIAVTDTGSTFEAYPVGTWADSKPHNRDARGAVLRLMGSHTPGAALVACLSDLGQTGVTNLQDLENKRAGKTSSPAQGEVKPTLGKERKGEGKDLLAGASPDTAAKKAKRTTMKAPTPDEVQTYSAMWGDDKRLTVSPDLGQRFCDYYESKGWKVGKTTMKSWQAAVRGWITRDKIPLNPGQTNARPGQRARHTAPKNNFGR
jgi:hypothetical protein